MPIPLNAMWKISLHEITLTETAHLGSWARLTATWNGHELGYLDSVDQNDGSILLSDVFVHPTVRVKVGVFGWLIRRVHPKWKFLYPRCSGVGESLVKRFLDSCQQRGLNEVFGNVTFHCIQTCPFLEKWYRSLGFQIGPPDGRAEFGPIAFKIIRSFLPDRSSEAVPPIS